MNAITSAVRPQASRPLGRPTLECLRQQYRRGEAVTLDAVFDAASLSERERRIVCERLQGRSYAKLAQDAALRRPDGQPFTRQRIQQMERDALAKLGLGRSMADAVHVEEWAEGAERLLERGRRLQGAFEAHKPGQAHRKPERWELRHEAAVQRFLRTAGV